MLFAECRDGFFGENCIGECPSNCNSCNKRSGICDLGCHPGWKGAQCTEGIYRNQLLGHLVIQATNISIQVMILSIAR